MYVDTVTLGAPLDESGKEKYHWLAGQLLVKILLDGRINNLRVYFAKEIEARRVRPRSRKSHSQDPTSMVRQGITLAENVALDKVYAIFWVCNPDINQIEQDCQEAFARDLTGSDRLNSDCQHDDLFRNAWERFWRTEKLRLPWKVGLRRENHDGWGAGTVIILTPPVNKTF